MESLPVLQPKNTILKFRIKFHICLNVSSAVKNFVREGPVNDVVSHKHCLESDCSFRLFSNS